MERIFWEYKIVIADVTVALLNEYGDMGWELVYFVDRDRYAGKLIFKRIKI